jgi:hypothetical protein
MMTAVGVLGVSGRVEAQAPAKKPVVAWLSGGGGVGEPPFLEGMREHGYVQGQNLTLQRADRVIE